MRRIAHLQIPHFDARVVQILNPSLRWQPVVVIDESDHPVDLSPEAVALGLRSTMTLREMRQACPELRVAHQVDREQRLAFSRRLWDACAAVSPRVELDGEGAAFVDLTGASPDPDRALASLLERVWRGRRRAGAVDPQSARTETLEVVAGAGPSRLGAKAASMLAAESWQSRGGVHPSSGGYGRRSRSRAAGRAKPASVTGRARPAGPVERGPATQARRAARAGPAGHAGRAERTSLLIDAGGTDQQVAAFLAPLPVRYLWPCPQPVIERLVRLGIGRIATLQAIGKADLVRLFGAIDGHHLALWRSGVDPSPVAADYPPRRFEVTVGFDEEEPGLLPDLRLPVLPVQEAALRLAAELEGAGQRPARLAAHLYFGGWPDPVTVCAPLPEGKAFDGGMARRLAERLLIRGLDRWARQAGDRAQACRLESLRLEALKLTPLPHRQGELWTPAEIQRQQALDAAVEAVRRRIGNRPGAVPVRASQFRISRREQMLALFDPVVASGAPLEAEP